MFFYQKNRFFLFLALFVLPISGVCLLAHADLSNLVQNNQESEHKQKKILLSKIGNNIKSYETVANAKDIKINPLQMQSILSYSTSSFLAMAQFGQCHFYALLSERMLMDVDGPIKNLIIDIYNGNSSKSKNDKETALMSIDDYLSYHYEKECYSNKEIEKLYSPRLLESSIKKFAPIIPKTEFSCLKEYQQFFSSPESIYLCHLLSNKKSVSLLSDLQKNFLFNICASSYTPQQFCSAYINSSYWNKVLNKEKDDAILNGLCPEILSKPLPLTPDDFKKCASALEQNPQLCLFNNSQSFSSLAPRPACSEISQALNKGRLKINYRDCPGKIGDEGISNAGRIIRHYQKKPLPFSFDNGEKCYTSSMSLVGHLIIDSGNEENWKFSICFDDPFEKKETCYATIAGTASSDPLAEENIIPQILKKIKGTDKNLRCESINSKQYNPLLLKYKHGCFLVFNEDECSGVYCPKKIVLNSQEIKSIHFQHGTLYNYFPIQSQNASSSLSLIMSEQLEKKPKTIRNTTQLKNVFESDPLLIVHGSGCKEILFPSFFHQTNLNQCTPLPFIIDAYFREQNKDFVVIRTAIDDIHAPRIMPWMQVFNAVRGIEISHPLNLWTLYALR